MGQFIHSILNAYYVPSLVVNAEDIAETKKYIACVFKALF